MYLIRAAGTRLAFRQFSTTVALTSSSGEIEIHRFPVDFLRENIKTAWDADSLQRVDNQLWEVSNIISSDPLTPSSWRLAFNDGTVGEFHLPPSQSDTDIEDKPKVTWGFNTSIPGGAASSLLRTRAADGGIRFSWEELDIDESGNNERAAEQLGGEW